MIVYLKKNEKLHTPKHICYFDNNATTRLSPSVTEYVANRFVDEFINASAQYPAAEQLLDCIDNDREYLAQLLETGGANIFFTSGATESINTILNPVFCWENSLTTVITSRLEHSAVDSCLMRLKKHDIKVLFIEHNKNGLADIDHLEELSKKHPRSLVNIIGANNETGVLQHLTDITNICKTNDCLVHVDAVQMLGRMPIDLPMLGVDFASFSAHKIGGLKGVGITYVREPRIFTPLILGGGQQNNMRGGTYNTGGIRALRLALADTRQWDIKEITALRDNFEVSLQKCCPHIIVNCQNVPRLCNTSNIYFPNISGHALLMELAARGIYVSLGSACYGAQPSKIIQQLGHSKDYAESCLRFSFADFNTKEEMEYALKTIAEVI